MALHDPILNVPFIDKTTGLVSEPWARWLLINKRDKANRVENATEDHIATLDADGHPQDGAKTLPTGDLVGLTDVQELSNKTFAELVATKILASDGDSGLQEIDLSDWVAGTSDRITITDGGDGSITITIPDTPELVGLLLSGLTASKLVGSDGSKNLSSVNISSFLSGTSEQITVADDGDGTATLSIPDAFLQSIACNNGEVVVHNNEVVII